MQKKLVVSSSPFLRNQRVTTRNLMLDVVIALLPTALAAVGFFGRHGSLKKSFIKSPPSAT